MEAKIESHRIRSETNESNELYNYTDASRKEDKNRMVSKTYSIVVSPRNINYKEVNQQLNQQINLHANSPSSSKIVITSHEKLE